MRKYDSNRFEEIFNSLGICKGDVIMVHSSLFNFGVPSDLAVSVLPERILNLLLKGIGTEGTLVVPTFNFDFCRGIQYNRQESKAVLMGAFSEFLRLHPESKRSKHPTQSVAVLGKLQDELIKDDTISPFSSNSPFEKLTHLDTKVLLLGSDFNSLSIVHMEEERQEVPYRFWKSFTGDYSDGGITQRKTYSMYVRDLKFNPVLEFSEIKNSLKIKNKVKEEKLGAGAVTILFLKDLLQEVSERLVNNPYYYVANHPKYLM